MDGYSASLRLASVCFYLALCFFGASEIAPLSGPFAVSPWAPWALKGLSALAGFGALCFVFYELCSGADGTAGRGRR